VTSGSTGAAIETGTARPIVPPSSREEFSTAEAIPASWGGTPAVAVRPRTTIAPPIPTAANSDGSSRARQNENSCGSRENRIRDSTR